MQRLQELFVLRALREAWRHLRGLSALGKLIVTGAPGRGTSREQRRQVRVVLRRAIGRNTTAPSSGVSRPRITIFVNASYGFSACARLALAAAGP